MKKIIMFFLILSVLFMSTSCSSDSSDAFSNNLSGKSGEGVLYLIGYNFENSNPLIVKNEANREIFSLIYDGLYTLDSGYKPVPKLAKDMTPSDDGLTWTITLNDNAYFHDGTKLSANDVVSTINYLINNSTYYAHNVRNIVSCKSNGKNEVILTLSSPYQHIQTMLTFPIVNAKELLSDFSFNGTGMYKVDNYIKRKNITLKPNSNYYSGINEEIRRIEVQLMPDKETANYSYSSGLSDVYSQDIFVDTHSLTPKTDSETAEFVSLNYNFLLLNHGNKVFSDKNVRRAIKHAINKDKIIEDVLFSHGEAVETPLPLQSDLYLRSLEADYDVNKAKELLLSSGYTPDINTGIMEKTNGEETVRLSFSILVNNDNNFKIQAANIISENLKYIGIDAQVKIVSFEEYQSQYINKTYEAFIGAIPMAPEFDLTMFMGDYNITNYHSDIAKRNLNNIAMSQNYQTKKEYYAAVQNIFYEDVPHISLYYTKVNLQHSSKLKGGLNPTGFSIYNNIEEWSFEKK